MTEKGYAMESANAVATLLERIAEIGPILSGNAAETEIDRRIAQENIDALESIGAFQLMVPQRHGGLGMSARDSMEALASIAEFCGSSAWVVMVINNCNWQASHLPVEGQDEIFVTADAKVAGSMLPNGTASPVDGGYVISGRWPYASGSLHANWAQLGIVIDAAAGDEPTRGVAYAQMADLTIEDTWFVAGMKGTGSNTLVAADVFVPDYRVYPALRVLDQEYVGEYPEEPASSAAFVPTLFLGFAGVQLGLGRAALRFVIEKAPQRAVLGTDLKQAESVGFQVELAQAAQLIETAHLHVFRAADAVDEFAAQAQPMPYPERARVRSDIAYAISRIGEALETLLTAHGSSSFAEVNPLQRIWRDSGIAARHAATIPVVSQEIYGKALLGVPYERNLTRMI